MGQVQHLFEQNPEQHKQETWLLHLFVASRKERTYYPRGSGKISTVHVYMCNIESIWNFPVNESCEAWSFVVLST